MKRSYVRIDLDKTEFDIMCNHLDMSLFEKYYAYEIKLSYKVNGKFREQKDTFKFRVE